MPDGDLAQSVNDLSTSLGQGISCPPRWLVRATQLIGVLKMLSWGRCHEVIAGIGNMLGSAKRDPRITIKAGYKVYLMNGN